MVRAWYMDASGADQRLPHQAAECEDVSLEELSKLGVEYWTVNVWCSYIHNFMHDGGICPCKIGRMGVH